MKQIRKCCFQFVVVQILTISSLVHVSTCSASSSSHHVLVPQQDPVPELLGGVAFDYNLQVHDSQGGDVESSKGRIRKLGRIGSRPPNCRRKCGRCTPCIATQIPTTTDKLGTQYTNYEPEGWKCQCHNTFFNP